MKHASFLAIALFVASSALAHYANASSDTPMNGMTDHEHMMKMDHGAMMKSHGPTDAKSATAPREKTQLAARKVKPEHDKTRHFHPRDGGKW